MAGSPTCGKISTGIRRSASAAHKAMAISATTTVNGRDRAAKTRRMLFFRGSPRGLRDEGLNTAGRGRNAKQTAPDVEPGKRVVDFSLRQQPLRFGDLIDVSQTSLITRAGLLRRIAGGGHLHWRVGGDALRAIESGSGAVPLRAKINCDLFRSRRLRPD